MHIVVLGAGHVGLVMVVCVARLGPHRVTMVEKSPARLDELRRGIMPIAEPGLGEAYREAGQRIGVAATIDEVEPPDFVFVVVATPISEAGDPDMMHLRSAITDLRAWPDAHAHSPQGCRCDCPPCWVALTAPASRRTRKFLRQGSATQDFAQPSRIVIGRYPETSAEHMSRLERIFSPIDAPRLDVHVAAAELIKNVANGFLALRLSFVNEVASLAEEFGVEVDEVLRGVALDPRIGSAYMRPGLGFGGSCLPKELQVLTVAGRRHGIPMHSPELWRRSTSSSRIDSSGGSSTSYPGRARAWACSG